MVPCRKQPLRIVGVLWIAAMLALGALGCVRLPPRGPMPPGATWCGLWDTNWGPIAMDCSGGQVQAAYQSPYGTGMLTGTQNGNYLDFQWLQQDGEAGYGVFVMNPDGVSFTGAWGYYGPTDGGGWSGYRVQ